MTQSFDIVAFLLILAAAFGFLNYRYFRLPRTIGLLVIALVVSLLLLGLDGAVPSLGLRAWGRRLLSAVDFSTALLDGALSFLLFAGALHVSFAGLWARKWTILMLATVGVMLSTGLLGVGMWGVFGLVHEPVPLIWCLVLGAVVAPTDPVAVLGILQRFGLPPTLQATVAGESLFNDGIGIVIFTILLGIATGVDTSVSAAEIATDFLLEAIGGGVLGLATGYVVFLIMRQIDEYNLELMISLALVMATYSVARMLPVSGPIAVVVAGLLVGNHATRYAMSETTRQHLETFWSFIDEIFNALLFLLIGFEMIVVTLDWGKIGIAACAIVLSLLARFVSVLIPSLVLHLHSQNKVGAIVVLTWGGLRGGIAVALALSLPDGPFRNEILAVCYAIVLFTIVVQGLTLERVVIRFFPSLND